MGLSLAFAIVSFWPIAARQVLIGRHQHRKREFDELFVLINGVKCAAHVVCDFGSSSLLDPVGQLKDSGLRANWFSLILNSREGSKSEFGIAIFS